MIAILLQLYIIPDFIFISQILGLFAALLTVVSFGSLLYNHMLQRDLEKELQDRFNGIVKEFLESWIDVLSQFFTLPKKEYDRIVEDVTRKYFKKYKLTESVDYTFQKEINQSIIEDLQKTLGFSDPFRLLLIYKFYESYFPLEVRPFLEKLNQQNIMIEGTIESEFFKMLFILESKPNADFETIKEKICEIEIASISSFINKFLILPEVVEKLRKFAEDQRKYANLKKIVSRCVLGGYISSKGLISLLKIPHDLICVMKFEGSLVRLKHRGKPIFNNKNPTPFRKVLVEYGFIKPSRYSKFTYMIPAVKVPEEYRANVDLFMRKEIIPKVEKEWAKLKKKYKIKRIQNGPDFKYIAFTISRHNIKWDTVNQAFETNFDRQVLGKLDKEKAIKLLISQTHNIPRILRRMEIDSLMDTGTDTMKEAIREKQTEIKEELSKMGYKITNVTDYRKLNADREEFAKIIMEKGNEILTNKPRAKQIDKKMSKNMVEEIIFNSKSLHELIENLGIEV